MCGIVGVVSGWKNGFSNKEEDMFNQMLYMDTLRGWDSTGVFAADIQSNVLIKKAALAGPDFMRTADYKQFMGKTRSCGVFAVGHNRAATRGTIKDENAHPFWVDDNIVLVQNGTYYGDHKHLKNTEVDSEAIAHVIAAHEDPLEALSKINAAYALVWYNVEKRCLYLVRNDQRPLHFVQGKNDAIFFASEKETLDWAVARNSVAVHKPPYMIAEDTLVEIQFGKEGGDWSLVNRSVPKRRPVILLDNNDEDDDPLAWSQWQRKMIGHHNPHMKPREGALDIHTTVRDNLAIMHPDQLHDYNESFRICEALNTLKQTTESFFVEVFDYEPANKHPECRMWHIMGHIVEAEPTPAGKALIHWFLYDKSEAEAMAYVGETWYQCKLTTVTREQQRPEKYSVSAFGSDVKQMTKGYNAKVTCPPRTGLE